MATAISRYEKGSRRKYPWHRWADGKPRRARKGKDFACSPTGFAATLYSHADRHDLTVSVTKHPEHVDFQFSPKSK